MLFLGNYDSTFSFYHVISVHPTRRPLGVNVCHCNQHNRIWSLTLYLLSFFVVLVSFEVLHLDLSLHFLFSPIRVQPGFLIFLLIISNLHYLVYLEQQFVQVLYSIIESCLMGAFFLFMSSSCLLAPMLFWNCPFSFTHCNLFSRIKVHHQILSKMDAYFLVSTRVKSE